MTPAELRERLARFAADVAAFADPLLDSPRTREAAHQLKDSSSSAASNHRAAGRARSHREFTAKLGVALEEADESLFWLQHLDRCGLKHPQLGPLLSEARELVAILTTSAATAQANDQASRRKPRSHRSNRRP